MTSVLNVDEIAAKDGTSPVSLTKQHAAKAWYNIDGTGTIAVDDSFNVASATDSGVGQYDVNFTSNLVNGNYAAVIGSEMGGGNGGFNGTYVLQTSTFRHVAYTNAGSLRDVDPAEGIVSGDLA